MKAARAANLLFKAIFKHDEYSAFLFFERVMARLCPRYKFQDFFRAYMYDEHFIRWYKSFNGEDNFLSLDRKYALDQLVKLVYDLEGDTAECGAFQGASSYLICRRIAGLQKKHHVFDSFEGLSALSSEDDANYWKQGDLASGEDVLQERLKEFDFVVTHKGWIPERFEGVSDSRFCFVHIDLDLYEPTLDTLRFFYPRTVAGGIVLCDDYGSTWCPGVRKAMDSFFADKREKVADLPTSQGMVIKR